jgi:NAD(P)-dependent dehydrogenase (short-subunit alcohol dehydrogenase family)
MSERDLLNRFRLDGKTAIVTGVGPGIGAHVVQAFASLGANVVANARTAERVHAVVDQVTAVGGSALAVPGDIGLKDDLERVVAATVDTYGGVEVLFHNAASGTAPTPAGSSLDLEEAVWQAAVNVNCWRRSAWLKRWCRS